MKETKAIVATIVIECMALLIMVGMFLLKYMVPFFVILGAFAACGFYFVGCVLAIWFADRTEKEKRLDPIVVEEAKDEEHIEYTDADIDELIEDVRSSI